MNNNSNFVNDTVKEIEEILTKQNLLPNKPCKKNNHCEWCFEEFKGFALKYYELDTFAGWYCAPCAWCANLAKEAFDNDDS